MEAQKRAIEELAKGQECASKLEQFLICKSEVIINEDSQFVEDLTEGVLKSFTNALSILEDYYGSDVDNEVSSQLIGPRSPQHSHHPNNTPKGSLMSHNHRKRKNTYTKYVDSPNWNIDGHAWRKYGQKGILKSKYPRNYFRCTHKNEHGCQATKQVQRIQEDPPLYRTTYFGGHTCQNLQNDPPKLVFDDLFAEEGNSKQLISFSNNNKNSKDNLHFSSFSSTKHQYSEAPSSDVTQNRPISLNYYVPSEMPEIFDHGVVHNPAEKFSQISSQRFKDNVKMVSTAEFDDLYNLDEYYYYT